MGKGGRSHGLGHVRRGERENIRGGHCISLEYERPALRKRGTDLIQRLAKRYPLGLASGSIHRVIDEVLAMQNLRSYFKDITSSEDVSAPKPSPEIFLLSAKRLGVPPEKCCVIEDTVNGIKAALAAGMTAVAITNTFDASSLFDAGADTVCSNYSAIHSQFI